MKHSLLATLALLSTVLFSCSRSETSMDILDAIPVDASTVIFTDFDRLVSEGVEITATTPQRRLAPLRSGISAFVTLTDGTSFAVSKSLDIDSLAAAGFRPADPSGTLTPYTSDDGLTVVTDSRSEIAYTFPLSAPRAIETVNVITAATKELSLSSNKGLRNYIEEASRGDDAIYGLIAQERPADTKPQEGRWLAFRVNGNKDEAYVKASVIKGSGMPVEIEGMQTIDTDFLRFLPDGMNIVAAAGLTPDLDWDAASAFIDMIADRQTASAISMIKPMLKNIDGTMAIAFQASSPEINSITDMQIFAMAHLDPDSRGDVMEQILRLAMLSGFEGLNPVLDEANNMMRFTLPASNPAFLYVGEVDGYLYIASFPPKAGTDNSYATAMEGHDAAAVINMPAEILGGNILRPGETLDVTFALDKTDATIRLAVPGATESPLNILLTRLSRIY